MSVNKTFVFFTLSRVATNKEGLLSRATAMLFPINWPEPFGEINHPNRADCRRAFGRRFDAERMARDYVDVYARLINDGGPNR